MLWVLRAPSALFLLSPTKPGDSQRRHHQGLIISCWGHRRGPWRSLPPASPPPPPCRGALSPSRSCRKPSRAALPGQHADPAGLTLMSPCCFPSRIPLTMSRVHGLKCTRLSLPFPCPYAVPCGWNTSFHFLNLLAPCDASKFPLLLEHPDLQGEVRDPSAFPLHLAGATKLPHLGVVTDVLVCLPAGCGRHWGQGHALGHFCSLNNQHRIWHTVGTQ